MTAFSRRPAESYDTLKRLIDITGAVVVLLISAPVQGIVGVLVARNLGRPVLFRQQRPGRSGVPFTMIKFRTMQDSDPARGIVTDEQRLTRFGAVLRSTSLDELPTLWNVLRGDMSLIGPRPLLLQYLSLYTPEQARRHEVRPGVTGLAQVSGRNALSWPAKFAADVDYVDRRNLWLDVQIALRTIASVFQRVGIAAPGAATMPEFGGSAAVDEAP